MLKKAHYTTFKKEIIIELQKTFVRIFNLELEQFKAESQETLPDLIISRTDSVYQEQIQSLK